MQPLSSSHDPCVANLTGVNMGHKVPGGTGAKLLWTNSHLRIWGGPFGPRLRAAFHNKYWILPKQLCTALHSPKPENELAMPGPRCIESTIDFVWNLAQRSVVPRIHPLRNIMHRRVGEALCLLSFKCISTLKLRFFNDLRGTTRRLSDSRDFPDKWRSHASQPALL